MSSWRGRRASSERSPVPPPGSGQNVAGPNGPSDLKLGEWVGEYVIVRKLGEGGFGAVYEALHPVIGKRAAVKILHAQYSSDEGVASRFAAEARAVNQIRHKSIVDIFSFGELDDGRHYYVMELLCGVPLDAYLERAGRLSLAECLPVLGEIAKALNAAHDSGIAHRDLKPENVFLELDDESLVHPKILDFGMAKLLAPGTLPVHKTRSGTPIGSPRYMSPEQCRGVQVDHRTDIYAFGCMAFRMLAGVPPFDAGTALELMMAHVSAPPIPLSSVGPDLGPKIDEALLKMLEKLPEKRPQSILQAFESLKIAAEAHFPDVVPANSVEASPLLLEMARERSQVNPPEIDVSKLRRTPGGTRVITGRNWALWIWAFAFLIVSVVAIYWQTRHESSRRLEMSSMSLPVAKARTEPSGNTASPAVSPSVSAVIQNISLTVATQPPHAELFLNKERVGVAPGPLQLPKGDVPLSLLVKSPGYHAQTVQVVPSSDQAIRVVLQPQRSRAAGNVPRDLENPY